MYVTLAIIILSLVLFAVLPQWSYSKNWGFGPTMVIAIILIILLLFRPQITQLLG